MHFFASTLAVLGIALFYSRFFRRNLAQVISAAVFTISISLYALSIAGAPLRVSCGLLMGLGLACLLGIGFQAVSKGQLPSKENVYVLVVYAFAAVFTYTYLYDKLATGWDEFSHWMLTLKNMHHFDSLGLGKLSSTAFQSYPPALQLFECFHLVFYPQFHESSAYLARTMLLICTLFAPAFHRTSNPLWGIAKLLILFCTPVVFYSSVYSMLYVDAALGMLFAHLLWLYYSEERFDRFFVFQFVLCASVLALIKGTGIALVIFALLAILLDFVLGKPHTLHRIAREHRRSFLLGSIALYVLPLIVYLSWKTYLSVNHIGDSWNTSSAITPQSIFALAANPQEYQVQTLNNFLYNVRSSFRLGRITVSFVRYPVIFLVLAVFSGVCAGNIRRGAVAGFSLSISYCIYVLSVLLTYLLVFSPGEAVGNASFRRYMNTQALACCMCTLILLLNPDVLSKQPLQKLPCIALFGVRFIPGKVLPALLALSFPLLSGAISTTAQLYLNARADAQFAIDYRADLSLLVRTAEAIENKESRIWYIHQTCNGDQYQMARMLATPIRLNTGGYSLAATADSKSNSYSSVKTAQKWSDELSAMYDYVYCDQITDAFIADYGALFEAQEDIASHAVYQVIPAEEDGGLVRLRLLERD